MKLVNHVWPFEFAEVTGDPILIAGLPK